METVRPGPQTAEQRWYRSAVLSAVLMLIMGLALYRTHPPIFDQHSANGGRCAQLAARINPNTDPWWKLAALPGIGRGKADRIVEFRKQHVLRRPGDLAQVRGIGPATVARIAPFLYFQ